MNILTAKEISVLLKKSLKFVYVNAVELGGVKIGGSWIFTQEGFKNALQRGRQMAGKGNFQGRAVHKSTQNKKSRNSLGNRKAKGAQEGRKALAERAGLAHLL
jgi:hypothetical protein